MEMVDTGIWIWDFYIRKWFELRRNLVCRVNMGSGRFLEEVGFQDPLSAFCGILSKTKAESIPRVLRDRTDQCGLCADGAEFGHSTIAGRCFEVRDHISSNFTKGSGSHLSAVVYRNVSDLLIGFFGSLEIPLASTQF